VTVHYFADMCYAGQSFTLEVPFALDATQPLAELGAQFRAAHTRVYGHNPSSKLRIVNLRSVHEALGRDNLDYRPDASTARDAKKGTRRIRMGDATEGVPTPIYDRAALPTGGRIRGPAILEQDDTTTIIGAAWTAEVLAFGHLLLTREERSA
jgi:N-methylhydantoinase A